MAVQALDQTQDDPTQPSLKPAVQKAPALPVATPGLSTQPLQAPTGTQTPPSASLPVAGQTSDPLAFAPTNNTGTIGSPATPGLQAGGIATTTGDAPPQTGPETPASSGMTTAQWDAYSPLAGLTEQQKAEYWAGQGTTGLAYGATPTGAKGDPNAGGSVSTYNPLQVASNDASLAAAGRTDPAVTGVQAAQASALGNYNATTQATNDAQALADRTALDNALNNQPGYAGSGMPYANPSGAPIANPLDAAHSPPGTTPAAQGPTLSGPTGTFGTENLTGSTPLGQYNPIASDSPATTGSPATAGSAISSSPTSGATLTGPVANAGPVNSQPTLTPLTPDNALTNSIISPNSNVDRFAVAKQQIQDEINNELNPQFKADLNTTAAQSFGAGRGVSGNNRSKLGDVLTQHERDINQLTSNYLNPALTGTIGDTLNNANFEAGQQAFEAGQQGTAFGQNLTLQQLQDQENQQQFDQALQKLIVGSQGDPATLEELLAQLYGGQSAQSSQAAQKLAASTTG